MAVVAMGKLGGREMQPASDLDLVLIYDHAPDAPESGHLVAEAALAARDFAKARAALAPLYPQKRLRGFIVWTRTATAVEAEEAALDEAFAIASR